MLYIGSEDASDRQDGFPIIKHEVLQAYSSDTFLIVGTLSLDHDGAARWAVDASGLDP